MKTINSFSKKVALCFLLFGLSKLAAAHYIWIETPFQWKTGKTDTIRFFYGEYAEGAREEAGKRLEEVNGLTAWIITPAGEKQPLALQKMKNHFSALYAPKLEGHYEIVLSDVEREVVDWRQYDVGIVRPTHYAYQTFFVGNTTANGSIGADLKFKIVPVKLQTSYAVNKPLALKLLFDAKDLKGKIMVYAPNTWMKEIESEDGVYAFTPLEKGRYIIESIYKERVPGNFKGKEYEATRHRTVVTIEVR